MPRATKVSEKTKKAKEDFEPEVEPKEEPKEELKDVKIISSAPSAKEQEGLDKDDENRRAKAVVKKLGFTVLELKAGRYRIVNNRKQWISPVMVKGKAVKLCNDLNMKDPEQRVRNMNPENRAKAGNPWGDESSSLR